MEAIFHTNWVRWLEMVSVNDVDIGWASGDAHGIVILVTKIQGVFVRNPLPAALVGHILFGGLLVEGDVASERHIGRGQEGVCMG